MPPLAISFALWPHLGPAYQPAVFQAHIPTALSTAETLLRVLVIALAAFLPLRWSIRRGGALYALGLLAYLASQLAATDPASAWSRSAVGFSAPAWTTLAWMLAIAWMVEVRPRWRWSYVALSVAFWAVHLGHALLVHSRL